LAHSLDLRSQGVRFRLSSHTFEGRITFPQISFRAERANKK
jgi:predicted MPP superfamily phosphohydrolase